MMICLHILLLSPEYGFAAAGSAVSLDSVLKKMDDAAANFHSHASRFRVGQYQKVVDETDTQKGTVYYRDGRDKEIEMMAEIKEPDPKFVLYKDGKLQVYQPKIDQVMEYPTGGNRARLRAIWCWASAAAGRI